MNNTYNSCIALSPASTANIGPGFDVFGLAIDAYKDKVKITKLDTKGNSIRLRIYGEGKESIPLEYDKNSCGLVLKKMSDDFDIKYDTDIEIYKGIPPGYGLGSSAASSAAAAVAFNELFKLELDKKQLVKYASFGEIASAGIKHYDNVAASVLGGFVIVKTYPDIDFIKINPPSDLWMIISIPKISIPKKKTEVSRSVLPEMIPFRSAINNLSNACTMVAGFYLNDADMIISGIIDTLVEPIRKDMIPSFDEVKSKALESGASAVTISGAGPSIIAFVKGDRQTKDVSIAMTHSFELNGIESKSIICRSSEGTKIIKE